MKIGVCSVAIGQKFQDAVKYGIRTKELYCQQHGYTFITDEKFTDFSRHLAWSKIPVLLHYLSQYEYIVWIDADTFIMNPDIKLETFITKMEGSHIMYAESRGWVNTGVMFVKNSELSRKVLSQSWLHTDQICWEQGAIDFLYRINWENCRQFIKLVPDQTEFNSLWYQYKFGQFLIHFPGCNEPDRPKDCLKRMMQLFCPIKMDEEDIETFQKRRKWLETNVENDIAQWYQDCMKNNKYVPI